MEILHRKLYEPDANITATYNCTSTSCSVYCFSCIDDYSPPSPSPVADASSADHTNHAMPYLVSAACVLGVAFLLLTTCTILLRHRWSRQRSSVRVASTSRDSGEDLSPVDHPVWHIVTVGLPQSVIDSITAVSYKSRDSLIHDSDCSVCLTKFEDGDDVRLLPKCSHPFHLPCIDTWLSSHKNCPLCRAPVVNDSSPVTMNPNSTPSGSARIESSENPRDPTDDDDDDGNLPIEGARTAEGGLSDVGENLRVVLDEDFQPVRRSISLDSSAAFAVTKSVVIDVGLQNGEGSSEKEKMVEEADKEGHGDSGISSLMKRSLSSSAKILSPFRGSKSQSSSSTLPL